VTTAKSDENKHEEKKGFIYRKKIIILVVIFVYVVISIGVWWAFFNDSRRDTYGNLSVDNKVNLILAQSTLRDDKLRVINSTLGFKVAYDKERFYGQGQVTDPSSTSKYVSGTTYVDDELDTAQEYSLVKFRPIEKENQPLGASFPIEMTILTNIRKDYWENRVNLPKNKDKSKLEIFRDDIIENNLKNQNSYETITDNPEQIIVNGVTYQKVNVVRVSKQYGFEYRNDSTFYFTVQNDRPYYVSFDNITNEDDELIGEYESIMGTIEFGNLDSNKLSRAETPEDSVLGATDELPQDTNKSPSALDKNTLFNVVAKNQIAVVRIGTVQCFDLNLVLRTGVIDGAVKDVCSASVGSGSIITEDGYIATNGHVVLLNVKQSFDAFLYSSEDPGVLANRIDIIMNFLVKRGDLTSAQKDSFIIALKSGDTNAIRQGISIGKLLGASDIKIENKSDNYIVQLSNQPIRLNTKGTKYDLVYTSTNVKAEYVDSNYDVSASTSNVDISKLTTSDEALLKVRGSYPTVELGTINNVQESDLLTAAGFPGFVDNGFTTTQSTTVPSITQGNVKSVGLQSQAYPYKLIATSVPIVGGNSGGPSFDKAGKQIGLNTYADKGSCNDGKCFGNGVIRDVDDLKKLADKNSISYNIGGQITTSWREGIVAFNEENYVLAAQKFNYVNSRYKDNYLAVEFQKISESEAGSSVDYGDAGRSQEPSKDYNFEPNYSGDEADSTVQSTASNTTSKTANNVAFALLVVVPLIGLFGGGVTYIVIRRKNAKAYAIQKGFNNITPVSALPVQQVASDPNVVVGNMENSIPTPADSETLKTPPSDRGSS